MRLRFAACAAVALAGLLAAHGVRGQAVGEGALKAAYVYNFLQLVEWPAHVLGAADAPLVVCTLGREPRDGFEALAGKRAQGRRIELRAVSGASLPRCHALYVPLEEAARLAQTSPQLAEAAVLVIVDGDRGAVAGAAITLVPRDKRIGFHIDLAATRKAGLRISSRLLGLALSVHGAP